jgi:hypothetical protein
LFSANYPTISQLQYDGIKKFCAWPPSPLTNFSTTIYRNIEVEIGEMNFKFQEKQTYPSAGDALPERLLRANEFSVALIAFCVLAAGQVTPVAERSSLRGKANSLKF